MLNGYAILAAVRAFIHPENQPAKCQTPDIVPPVDSLQSTKNAPYIENPSPLRIDQLEILANCLHASVYNLRQISSLSNFHLA